MKDVNKIIFDFIWKGKDKVKRFALISGIEDGGLKRVGSGVSCTVHGN